jgi:opacity protein-like surface antigen
MKKVAGCMVAVALALGVGAPAWAGTFGLGLTGGVAIPSGDFSDAFDTGFNGSAYAEYWFNDQGAIGFDLGYSRHDAKQELTDALNAFTEYALILSGATTASSDLEVSASFFQAGLHAKWAPPTGNAVAPYLQGGLGLYSVRTALEGPVTADGVTIEINEDDSESDFGLNAGVGVLFKASPTVSLGVAGAFHNVFTKDQSTQFFTLAAQAHFMTGAH